MMRILTVGITVSVAVVLALSLAGTPSFAQERPSVVVFDIDAGPGVEPKAAETATKAFRDCLRETGKVVAIMFDPAAPTVQRAILEKKITTEQLADYTSEAVKTEMARALGFDYAAWGGVVLSNKMVRLNTWICEARKGSKPVSFASRANASGTGPYDLDNAIQVVASSASNYYAVTAFKNLTRSIVSRDEITTGAGPGVDSTRSVDTGETDFAALGERSYEEGRVAEAIQLYSRAVTADPNNVDRRVRLAQLYAVKGMFAEANDELDRAILVGGDKAAIERVREGFIRPEEADVPPAPSERPKARPELRPPVPPPDTKARERIIQGDKLWASGEIAGAIEAYREAAVLDPREWRAHERLAILLASAGKFGEAKKSQDDLKNTQPNPAVDVLAARYALLAKAFDKRLSSVLDRVGSDLGDFASHRVSREAYYGSLIGTKSEVSAMTTFLDSMSVPTGQDDTQLRRNLAVGLVSQAVSNLIDYTETNSKRARSNADTFLDQARTEIEGLSSAKAGR